MPIDIEKSPHCSVVSITGPLNSETGADLVTLVKNQVPSGTPVIVDCSGLVTAEDRGVYQLMVLKRHLDKGRSKLLLSGVTPELLFLLKQLKIEDLLKPLYPTLGDARSVLDPGGSSVGENCSPIATTSPEVNDHGTPPTPVLEVRQSQRSVSPPPIPPFPSLGETPVSAAPVVAAAAAKVISSSESPTMASTPLYATAAVQAARSHSASPSPTSGAPRASSAPEPDAWGAPATPAKGGGSGTRRSAAPPVTSSGWDTHRSGGGGAAGSRRGPAPADGGGNKKLWILLSSIGGIVLLGILTWLLWPSKPVIRIFEGKTTILCIYGMDPPEFVVEVENGQLDLDAAGVPIGCKYPVSMINVTGDREDSKVTRYRLDIDQKALPQNGQSLPSPGRFSLVPESLDEKKKGDELPVEISFKYKDGIEIRQNRLDLTQGKQVPVQIATVASNAKTLTAANLPDGLVLEQQAGTLVWMVKGSTEETGERKVTFAGTDANGAKVDTDLSMTFAIKAKPIEQQATQTTNPAMISASSNSSSSAALTTLTSPYDIDDDPTVKGLLIERIAGSQFDETKKVLLKSLVEGLTKKSRFHVATFEKEGQTQLSQKEAEKLKVELTRPGVKETLSKENVQVFILGYASKTGSYASNVRISKMRAGAVKEVFDQMDIEVDLYGDYGPTSVLGADELRPNRAVEIYVGVLEVSEEQKEIVDMFKTYYQKRFGPTK